MSACTSLMVVLREHLGHRIANAVEQAKIGWFCVEAAQTIALESVETGLAVQLTPADLAQHLDQLLGRVVACAQECVRRAGVAPQQLAAVYLTGGLSALRPFPAGAGASFSGCCVGRGGSFWRCGVGAGLRRPCIAAPPAYI